MILIDPELASAPAPPAPAGAKLPSVRTLSRFLSEAQTAVRLGGHVTVLLTGNATMRDLNRRFRGKNKPTDVLSFPASDLAQVEEKGDLAIGVDTALRQAAERGHTLAIEIKLLILHGLLHLAGYDHVTDDGRMARRERRLRAELGLPEGLIERASRGDARKSAPDGARRRARQPQSGAGAPQSAKPRRGRGNAPSRSTRKRNP